jgi:hypothetical protein
MPFSEDSAPGRPGLIWGVVMGPEEAAAHESAADVLERGLLRGELRPQAPGWRLLQRDLVARHPAEHGLVDKVLAERIARWMAAGSPVREALLVPLKDRLRATIATPPRAAEVVEPLRSLLLHIGSGISLTKTDGLPRALGVKVAERFGWRHAGTEIAELYEFAWRIGALRRTAHRLSLTQSGRRLTCVPEEPWRTAARQLAPDDHAELALIRLVTSGPATVDELARVAGDVRSVQGLLRPAHLLGIVSASARAVRLTDLGRSAALLALEHHATAPA